MEDVFIEPLYLVGFRIEPDIVDPQLYTIYLDNDHPIMSNGQPVCFTKPELAVTALEMSDHDPEKYGPVPTELNVVFDFAEAIYVLCKEDRVANGGPVNCLNVLLDFANCSKEPMPPEYRKILQSLADHLTFNEEFGTLIEREKIRRDCIRDALYWAIGMAVYRMKIVT